MSSTELRSLRKLIIKREKNLTRHFQYGGRVVKWGEQKGAK